MIVRRWFCILIVYFISLSTSLALTFLYASGMRIVSRDLWPVILKAFDLLSAYLMSSLVLVSIYQFWRCDSKFVHKQYAPTVILVQIQAHTHTAPPSDSQIRGNAGQLIMGYRLQPVYRGELHCSRKPGLTVIYDTAHGLRSMSTMQFF